MRTLENIQIHQDDTANVIAAMHITAESTVNLWYAHPDDEAAATPELLRILKIAGAVIHIAHATVGEDSTLGDPNVVQSGGRMVESASFNNSFDISTENQHIFLLPDGQLYKQTNKLLGGIAMLADQTNATHLVAPALHRYERQPHRDHKAVWKAGRDIGRVFGLMGRPLEVWSHARPDTALVTLPVDAKEKVEGFRHFPTQFTFDPEDSVSVEFYGHYVSQKTADDLGQYHELFVREHYGPHYSVPLVFPNSAYEAVNSALDRAEKAYQYGIDNRHPTSGAHVYSLANLVQ
jgi:LmbE family N-acetylglucosaminyl deacetylase